jgi:hypothetical protein
MWIEFDKIADTARVWVYQANRPLAAEEVRFIDLVLQPALSGWAAHGASLLASARVVENRFVVIAVDEDQNLPSGCSIDASTHFLQQIGQQLSANGSDPIDFFDRSVAFVGVNGEVETLVLPAIKPAVMAGQLMPDTLVVNTLIKTKAEFLTDWKRRAAATWLVRYFKTVPDTYGQIARITSRLRAGPRCFSTVKPAVFRLRCT